MKSCDAFLIVNRKPSTRQTLQLFTAICGIPLEIQAERREYRNLSTGFFSFTGSYCAMVPPGLPTSLRKTF